MIDGYRTEDIRTMTYAQALALAYDRQLFGAQAYNLARVPGETRSAKEIYDIMMGGRA